MADLGEDFYRLNRDGGQDRIKDATYSPKIYRQENARPANRNSTSILLIWTLIATVVFAVAYFVEHKNEFYQLRDSLTVLIQKI